MSQFKPTPVQKKSMLRLCEESFKEIVNEWDRKNDLVSFFDSNSQSFNKLVEIALTNKHPEGWHAAWVLDACIKKDDTRLDGYIQSVLDSLFEKKDGHQRQWLRIMERLDLNDEQEGHLFDLCLSIWEKIGKIPSVRHFAFVNLLKIAKKYPDLVSEIEFITQDHYLETLSPGIKNSIIRMNKEFQKKYKKM